MKTTLRTGRGPTDEEIRDYAYHLYEQSGCIPGREEENWFEAKQLLMERGQSAQPVTRQPKRENRVVYQM